MRGDPREKCFGTVAMEKGFITLDKLIKAINIQSFGHCLPAVDKMTEGKGQLLGKILVDHGEMTPEQLHQVLAALGKGTD